MEVGTNLYHICEFAELCERNGHTVEPAAKENTKSAKDKETTRLGGAVEVARKFDLTSELYERTCFAVTDNPVNWQSFLKTAGRNFRLRFDEQLLIYAQRPDATAVLEIERWNGTFGRWVNRGAKGNAVFEDTDRSRQRMIHYIDISDTH